MYLCSYIVEWYVWVRCLVRRGTARSIHMQRVNNNTENLLYHVECTFIELNGWVQAAYNIYTHGESISIDSSSRNRKSSVYGGVNIKTVVKTQQQTACVYIWKQRAHISHMEVPKVMYLLHVYVCTIQTQLKMKVVCGVGGGFVDVFGYV